MICDTLRRPGVKVTGVFLHNISGKLGVILSTSNGRRLVASLMLHLTDLQLSIGKIEEVFGIDMI